MSQMLAKADSIAAKYGLNARQARFVLEYLVDLNASQAAVRSGYSDRNAKSIGQENMTKPKILAAIQEEMAERSERTKIDADYVLQQANELLLKSLGEKPITKTLNVDGALIEQTVHEFNANGVGKALELLGKHVDVQAFKERLQHEGELQITKVERTIVDPQHTDS